MAQQKSIIKLKGNIGDISFFKNKDGYQARERGGVDPNRIATDPSFQRTRENGAEFGRAGKAGKLLRNALKSAIRSGKDSRMTSRLTRDLVKVIQSDTVNERGLRDVTNGNIELLAGFEFNENGRVSTIISAAYTTSIDRTTGSLTINFPAFVPSERIVTPTGASHFKLKSAAASIDFDAGSSESVVSDSDLLPLDSNMTEAIALESSITAGSSHPLFLALGIEFYQEVNGKQYLLSNGLFNGLSLVAISVE